MSAPTSRTIAIAKALQIRDEPLLAGVGIGPDDGLPGPVQVQIPGRVEDRRGGAGVGIHLDSPLEAMQAGDAAKTTNPAPPGEAAVAISDIAPRAARGREPARPAARAS